MKWLRALLSGILLLALVPVLSSLMIVNAFAGVYDLSGERATEATARAVAMAMKEPVIDSVAMHLSDPETGWGLPADEVRTALHESLDDQEIAAVSASVSVALENAATGSGPTVVHLGTLVDDLLNAIRGVVEVHVAAMPVCTAEQAAQLANFMLDGLPDCRASDPAINRAVLDQLFAELRASIPEDLDLSLIGEAMEDEEVRAVPSTAAILGAGLPGGMLALPFQMMSAVSAWGWLAALLLALGLIALNLDQWYRPLGWLGWAFLLSSSAPLLMAAAAPMAFAQVPGDGELAARIAQSLLAEPLARARMLGLLSAGLGVACIAAAVVGARMQRPQHLL